MFCDRRFYEIRLGSGKNKAYPSERHAGYTPFSKKDKVVDEMTICEPPPVTLKAISCSALNFFLSAILTIFTCAPLWLPVEIYGAQSMEIGIIMADTLHVRTGPGKNHPSSKVLLKETRVEILEHCRGWLKILHEDQTGYIRNSKGHLRIIRESRLEAENHNDINGIRVKAEKISRQIKRHKSEVLSFTKEETAIISSLNEMDRALNKARQRVATIESELQGIENKLKETAEESEKLRERIRANEENAYRRLVSVYKLNRLGKMQVLVSAESVNEFFMRKKIMEWVLANDEKILKNLLEDKAGYDDLQKRLNEQKMDKLSIEDSYHQQIESMSHEKSKRSKVLEDIRNKKSLEMAAIESLKQAASELNKTIASFKAEYKSPENFKNISQKSFTSFKGLLMMPVRGKIYSFFGTYKNRESKAINFRSGIDIKADRGEPVHAVYHGKILYSDWFKGYGNMIIIDHGENYYTVYAHAEEIFKAKGEDVEMGEVIATVGETGSMAGPKLHFEIRHHGNPIDPLQWINPDVS
jgi:septal ring factor EnvC (AmiA/AmiB activator)